jgi:hypothetical protein
MNGRHVGYTKVLSSVTLWALIHYELPLGPGEICFSGAVRPAHWHVPRRAVPFSLGAWQLRSNDRLRPEVAAGNFRQTIYRSCYLTRRSCPCRLPPMTEVMAIHGATRQTVPPTSSATSSAPVLSTARPTGRPWAVSPSIKPVNMSSGMPLGLPLAKGTNTTL